MVMIMMKRDQLKELIKQISTKPYVATYEETDKLSETESEQKIHMDITSYTPEMAESQGAVVDWTEINRNEGWIPPRQPSYIPGEAYRTDRYRATQEDYYPEGITTEEPQWQTDPPYDYDRQPETWGPNDDGEAVDWDYPDHTDFREHYVTGDPGMGYQETDSLFGYPDRMHFRDYATIPQMQEYLDPRDPRQKLWMAENMGFWTQIQEEERHGNTFRPRYDSEGNPIYRNVFVRHPQYDLTNQEGNELWHRMYMWNMDAGHPRRLRPDDIHPDNVPREWRNRSTYTRSPYNFPQEGPSNINDIDFDDNMIEYIPAEEAEPEAIVPFTSAIPFENAIDFNDEVDMDQRMIDEGEYAGQIVPYEQPSEIVPYTGYPSLNIVTARDTDSDTGSDATTRFREMPDEVDTPRMENPTSVRDIARMFEEMQTDRQRMLNERASAMAASEEAARRATMAANARRAFEQQIEDNNRRLRDLQRHNIVVDHNPQPIIPPSVPRDTEQPNTNVPRPRNNIPQIPRPPLVRPPDFGRTFTVPAIPVMPMSGRTSTSRTSYPVANVPSTSGSTSRTTRRTSRTTGGQPIRRTYGPNMDYMVYNNPPRSQEDSILDLDCVRHKEREIDGWGRRMKLAIQTIPALANTNDIPTIRAYLAFHMRGNVRNWFETSPRTNRNIIIPDEQQGSNVVPPAPSPSGRDIHPQ